MKNTFNILKLGLKNPRYYIESINLKWRHVLLVALIAVISVALGLTVKTYPFIQQISQDMTNATEYIPDYSYTLGSLNLAEGEKPLYYNSSNFQLVIDDSIRTESSERSIPLSEGQLDTISQTTPLNLFMFKDRTFFGVGNQVRPIPQSFPLIRTPNNLTVLLNSLNQQTGVILVGVFISFFLSNIPIYLFEMLFLALLIGIYNIRLTQRLTFGARFKLAVMVSLLPIIVIEIATLLFPALGSTYTLMMFISLILIYFVFRNHTRFIHQIMNQMQIMDVKDIQEQQSDEDDNNDDKTDKNSDSKSNE